MKKPVQWPDFYEYILKSDAGKTEVQRLCHMTTVYAMMEFNNYNDIIEG